MTEAGASSMYKNVCKPCMHRKIIQVEASEEQSLQAWCEVGLLPGRLAVGWCGQVRWADQRISGILCPLRIAKFYPGGIFLLSFNSSQKAGGLALKRMATLACY